MPGYSRRFLLQVLALVGILYESSGWVTIKSIPHQTRGRQRSIPSDTRPRVQHSNHNQPTLLWDISSTSHSEGLSRLHSDLSGLIKWIEKAGGKIEIFVNEGSEGWTIHANRRIKAGEDLIVVPKSLCIFANPDLMEVPLLENAQLLMKSLDEKQWRARLAIALLSERVRPSSHFRSYLRNLPFEFWGVPVFYSTQEFGVMQDLGLMQQTRDRCRFLSEFAESVLSPLRKSNRDPFSGHNADVNAFGWGFASAASRALRNPSVIGDTNNQVMVPGIDLASHSPTPNCEVLDAGSSYILRSLSDIDAKTELTIDYGPLSNDQLLADYGFTVDDNPHDRLMVSCDGNLLNTARMVMGQVDPYADIPGANKVGSSTGSISSAGGFSFPSEDMSPSSTSNAAAAFRLTSVTAKEAQIGRGGHRYDESWLHQWQLYWLAAVQLHGPDAQFVMRFGGPGIDKIDPRMWAFLRILYSRNEKDLLKHGYDPYLLKKPGSCIDSEKELQVVKTMVGTIAVLLRVYGTELESDINALKKSYLDLDEDNSVAGGVGIITASSDDIITDVHRILRTVFEVPHPLPFSPTARRATLAAMAAAEAAAAAAVTAPPATTSSTDAIAQGISEPSQGISEGVASAATTLDGSSTSSTTATNDASAAASGSTWSPSAIVSKQADGLDHEQEHPSESTSTSASDSDSDSVEQLVQKSAGVSPTSIPLPPTVSTSSQKVVPEGGNIKAATTAATPAAAATVAAKKTRGTPFKDIDLSAFGSDLPVNVRESLKYRIRKKRALHQLIWDLGQVYENLRQSAIQVGTPAAVSAAKDELLPGAVNLDKGERRAKIRELVDEVRQRSPKEQDLLLTAGKIAGKWLDRGLAL